jgi:hypothetical protein
MEDERILQILEDVGNALEALGVRIRHAVAELEGQKGPAPAPAAMKEDVFAGLVWESQEGKQIGLYEVAYKANNEPNRWTPAHEFLEKNKAAINARYHGEGYVHSYWLYHDNKIYRQKLKQA